MILIVTRLERLYSTNLGFIISNEHDFKYYPSMDDSSDPYLLLMYQKYSVHTNDNILCLILIHGRNSVWKRFLQGCFQFPRRIGDDL